MLPQLIDAILEDGDHTYVVDLSTSDLVYVPLNCDALMERISKSSTCVAVTEFDSYTVYKLSDGFAITLEFNDKVEHIAVSRGVPMMDALGKFVQEFVQESGDDDRRVSEYEEDEQDELLAYFQAMPR